MTLRPYWITVEGALGIGVTAQDEQEALALSVPVLAALRWLDAKSIRPILNMDELDQEHVVPNMGLWLKRGVWFPRWYD